MNKYKQKIKKKVMYEENKKKNYILLHSNNS